MPGDLRLDSVKLLIECTGLLGLAFGPVGFDVPQSEGHFFLTTETGLGSIDGYTAVSYTHLDGYKRQVSNFSMESVS